MIKQGVQAELMSTKEVLTKLAFLECGPYGGSLKSTRRCGGIRTFSCPFFLAPVQYQSRRIAQYPDNLQRQKRRSWIEREKHMNATISVAIEPLIRKKFFNTEEEAIRELTREYILRQIAALKRKIGRFERKYGMRFQQFSDCLPASRVFKGIFL